jgi:hypothetical protein
MNDLLCNDKDEIPIGDLDGSDGGDLGNILVAQFGQ